MSASPSIPGSTTAGVVVASSDTRRHVYDLAIAVAALLIAAGFLTPDEAQLWLNLAAALVPVLGVILARLNAPKGRHAQQ